MKPNYSLKMRVTSYDVGITRTLKPSSILKMMQEVAGRHLEQSGLSYEYMRKNGIVFLLVKMAVNIRRMPVYGEDITVETWFSCVSGVKFARKFRFTDEEGNILIEALTYWVIVNPETHKILRPSAFPFEMPSEDIRSVNVEIVHIKMPKSEALEGVRVVRWSDIDSNNHMNNAVYADIICDFFPKGLGKKELKRFQIDFDGEAELGDEINIKTTADEHGAAVYEGTIKGRKCFMALAQANM